MNKEIIYINVEMYNKIINRVDKFNPIEARSIYNKVNYVIFTVANFYRIKESLGLRNPEELVDIFKILLEIQFINKDEFNYIKEFVYSNEDILKNVFDIVRRYNDIYDIFDLYEYAISLDIKVENGYYCVVKENKHRDRAGAYYTSKDFARTITKKALEQYLSKKCNISVEQLRENLVNRDDKIISILRNSQYVDLSCGTGHFIIAFVEYIKEFIDDKSILKDIYTNIYGFDIDVIAIQIIKTQIVLYCDDIQCIRKINSNFIVGNTLINNEEDNYIEKINLVFQGYIYHSKLGINQKKFDSKFDVILGNPPWEKIRFEDKNFFANYCPRIGEITKKDLRVKEILKLNELNPKLKSYYDFFTLQIEECKKQIKENDRLKQSSNGELNTYALFTELAIRFLKDDGCIALIVKSGLITTAANSKIFNYLLDNNLIVSLDDFINKNKLFPIDSRERFTVIILRKYYRGKIALKMMLESMEQLESEECILIDKKMLNTINPINNMIPNISSSEELILLTNFYNKFNVFEKEFPNCKFGRLVHLTNHSEYIYQEIDDTRIPIYEGKFIEIYDNKFSTFKDMSNTEKYKSKATSKLMTQEEKEDKRIVPESRYFIEKDKWIDITKNYPYQYSVVWRSLTSTTNRRTTIASILPHCPTTQSIQLLQYGNNYRILIIILALFNSCIFDYLVRLKLNGIDLTQAIIKQIPVPKIQDFNRKINLKGEVNSLEQHIFKRIAYLYNNDTRLNELFEHLLGGSISEPRNLSTREVTLELDYVISLAYQLNKEQLIAIMRTFKKEYTDTDIKYITLL